MNACNIALENGNFHTQISTAYREQIVKNRNYMKVFIDFTLYSAWQGIPFRGHDECNKSFNQVKLKTCIYIF